MNKQQNKGALIIMGLVLGAIGVWLALKAGMCFTKNISISAFISAMEDELKRPFDIRFTERTPIMVLLFLIFAGILVLVATSCVKNTLQGREMGGAKWGVAKQVNKHLVQKENILLTENVKMGLCTKNAPKGHDRNLNVAVIGGSGAGKTFYYVIPNLLQANTNYVVVDPSGELLLGTAQCLKNMGYAIKVINLVDMEASDGYNPFSYCKEVVEFEKVVNIFWQATGDKNASKGDPFWDDSAKMLLKAMIFYLVETDEEVKFSTLNAMLLYADAKESEDTSPLDELFAEHAQEKPDSLAVRFYHGFSSIGGGKTKQSILVVLLTRLSRTLSPGFNSITDTDEIDLHSLYGSGKKEVLYLVIPTVDTTYSFLSTLLYTQMFDLMERYYVANGELPRHLRFLMDEFANTPMPDDFQRVPATCRKINYSVNIILQGLGQLEGMFRNGEWKTILGNCDVLLYLGG